MVDKALRNANDARTERLDAIASAELGYKVVTTLSLFCGPTGAYVTRRADGKKMSKTAILYVQGLWTGWNELEGTLLLQQEKARR